MSPFTADANVLKKVLGNEGEIWKVLSGPIQTIHIFDRQELNRETQVSGFTIEIQTEETIDMKICKGIFRVETLWDFMAIKEVRVQRLEPAY